MSANDVAKPLGRRRRCFGGGQGVWWRKRSSQTPIDDDGSSKQSSSDIISDQKASGKCKMESEIRWDEELCRPVYRTKASQEESVEAVLVVSDGDNNNSNCGKSSSQDSRNDATADPSSTSVAEFRWEKASCERICQDRVSPEPSEFVICGRNNEDCDEGTSRTSSPLPSSPFSPCTSPSIENSAGNAETQWNKKEPYRSRIKATHRESSGSEVSDHGQKQHHELTASGTSSLPRKFNTLLVKRRRSFGGTQGVWWRRRAATATGGPSASQPPSDSSSSSAKGSPNQQEIAPDDAAIQWDEDLCRPIYRLRHSQECAESLLEDADDCHDCEGGMSETSSPPPSSPTASSAEEEQVNAPTERLWSKGPVKRNKTFGSRKSSYSFVLLGSNIESASAASTGTPSSSQDGITATSSTPSFGRSLADSKQLGAAGSNNDDSKKNDKQRRVVPKDEASLRKARRYFDELDAERLMLDFSKSPLCSSKVTRTTHKVNLQSPRLQKEYRAYARASRESGISPWSMKSYVSSRRDFFRKRELFDGFLDDF